MKKEIKPDLFVSAETNQGTEELKELIFQKLNLIRIYLKEIQKKSRHERTIDYF